MIEQLFGSKTRVKMLYLFLQHQERSYYVREIAREIGAQLNAVRREIANLVRLGLIAENKGNQMIAIGGNARSIFYKVRTDHLLFSELKALLLKGEMLQEQEMVRQLQEKSGELKLMLLTGQFINSVEVGTDILFVGKIKPLVVARILNSFEKSANKEIRYTVLSEKEFTERREIGDKFLYAILESKFLVVVDNLNLYET